MVRTSPMPAKENDAQQLPSPLKKKSRGSMRVSFGHVELHTFLKDADRTPSPMPAPAAPAQLASAEPHAVAALRAHGTSALAAQPLSAPRARASAPSDQAPQLSDLLRDDDDVRAEPVNTADDDEDDVVFQPRAAADGVTMEFTQAYGIGIREVRADLHSSPAQEAASIPMEFTRSYGVGILSSGGLDGAEPMDEDEDVEMGEQPSAPAAPAAALPAQPAAAAGAEPLTYDRFLAAHGIQFLDKPHAEPPASSLAPAGEAAELQGLSGEAQHDQALIIAATCIRPQGESAQWGAEQLGASCAQLRAAIAQTEELVCAEASTFFENVGSTTAELHALKALCRNGALAMWYEWRSKLEASNAQVLDDSRQHLLADRSRLESLLHSVREAGTRAREDPRAASLSARADDAERKAAELGRDVARREAALADASARVAAARAAEAALRAQPEQGAGAGSTAALEQEEAALVAKLGSLRASIDQLVAAVPDGGARGEDGEPRSDACARAQEQALMAACLGWRAVTLTSTQIMLQFSAGMRLSAQLAPMADKKSLRLRAPPTIERCELKASSDGVAAMLADLATCAVAREAASCVSLQALPLLVQHLGALSGRALELRREIGALSAPYSIQCTREPAIVGGKPGSTPVLTVTFSNSKHQLRFKAALRIDALSMPPTITYQRMDIELCPAGLSHGRIANCVVAAMASTERVALLRLTAICEAVQQAADAACSTLAQ